MTKSEAKPSKGKSPVLIAALCCGLLLMVAALPASLLLTADRQFEAGNWGMRLLPKNHPWVGQARGVRTVVEGFSAGGGGSENMNGTRMTTPPGLVHKQVKQWGRLQWWHMRVVKEPGKYDQGDVQALAEQAMARRHNVTH